MGLFKKGILSNERVESLDKFRGHAIKALEELRKKAKNKLAEGLYNGMVRNVQRTPIYFYPRKALKETIHIGKGLVLASVVKGEHVNEIRIFQKGRRLFLLRSNYINLPAEHIFEGSRLTMAGLFTLAHEYAHFPKPQLLRFAKANRITRTQAEELLADTLSAKLAVAMGYPKENVMQHFRGRELVYGQLPFKKFIWNAVNS